MKNSGLYDPIGNKSSSCASKRKAHEATAEGSNPSPRPGNRGFESTSFQRRVLANLRPRHRGFESAFPPAASLVRTRFFTNLWRSSRAPMRRHPARRGASTSDQAAPAEIYAFPATTFVEPARSHYTRIQLKTLCASAT